MASDDPFLEAQTDILSLLNQARPLLSSYLRIRSSASSASSPELVEAREELESTLTDLSTDLQDLVDSVKAVEGDPYKFGLDVAEVSRRRKLVEDVGREVEDMHRRLNETVNKADGNKARTPLAHPDSFVNGDGEDDDDYGAWEEQRQTQIMHEQDQALDGVFQTVGNLRAQADTMGRELEEQAELLDDTENITDRVGGKLATGMKKLRYVVDKNEGKTTFLPPDGTLISVLITNRSVLVLLHRHADLGTHHSTHFGPSNMIRPLKGCLRQHVLGEWVPTSPAAITLKEALRNDPNPGDFQSKCMTNVSDAGFESDRKTITIIPGLHPLLQQTPLSVNPFIDLPKAPTLPHNYASLPSTLPPSMLNSPPALSNPELPAYVTSSSGFAAHPRTIIAQDETLLDQIEKQQKDARKKVQRWEQSIKDRELAEKRRKAPGWLDSDNRILQPERPKAEMSETNNLMDEGIPTRLTEVKREPDVDDLGAAMDRAFGRSDKR